jgi:hypothetical protein
MRLQLDHLKHLHDLRDTFCTKLLLAAQASGQPF